MNIIHYPADNSTVINLRLYDNRTNQDIPWVYYHLNITTADASSTPIVNDFFQTHNGTLVLKIVSDPSLSAAKIIASREPFIGAYVADPNSPIVIMTPFIKPSGSYLLHAEIFGVYYPTNIFDDRHIKGTTFAFDGSDVVNETHAVPEFSIIYLVMAASVAGVIALFRTKIKFGL
ncbi:hypothetical protein NTE_01862 [Candidatus Nitrososphaera evergladensis SR1]|uniref:Uncharacterized protein n=2 Tax=Nitrososphaera TaxID=497726 RepID=A0A075MT05_9ARCH|nr:hypothetical protein NTE_01862 [Candidatus Nitrososphaera evergladensis SR1]